jgi:hypothetical protein
VNQVAASAPLVGCSGLLGGRRGRLLIPTPSEAVATALVKRVRIGPMIAGCYDQDSRTVLHQAGFGCSYKHSTNPTPLMFGCNG